MKTFHYSLFLFLAVAFGAFSALFSDISGNQRNPAQVLESVHFEIPAAVRDMLYYEQKLINRKIDENLIIAPDIHNQGLDYRPENGNWFVLETYWLPEEGLHIAQAPSREKSKIQFTRTINGKKFYRLLVHPESKGFYKDVTTKALRGGDLFATSTSSSRTLVATNGKGGFSFVKLSLDVRLGDVVRTIPSGEVARSVGVSKYLDTIHDENLNFKFIKETLGIIPDGMKRGGQIIREFPLDAYENGNKLVPLFSLYTRDESGTSLIERMLKRRKRPISYIEEMILRPFAKSWVDMALDYKTVMEAHAQNVLLQIDRDEKSTKTFYHRDFGGFNIRIDKKDENFFPIFSNLDDDYFVSQHKVAVRQSLENFFEGGFLFNLNNELERIGVKGEDLRDVFRDIIIDELKLKTNMDSLGFSKENIYSELPHFVVKHAQVKKVNSACIDQYVKFFGM